MNKKMMFFALAGKCGGFGASGLEILVTGDECAFSANIDVNAIAPNPIEQRPKKCLRLDSSK
jgi:hypothetical protein